MNGLPFQQLQRQWLFWYLFISVFALVSCTNIYNQADNQIEAPAESVTPDLIIKMYRYPCWSDCPVYEIKITGNGLVTYSGLQDVDVLGTKMTTITQEQVKQLITEINNVNFFEIDTPSIVVRDCPAVEISITLGERSNSYMDYQICYYKNFPEEEEMLKLEKMIDLATNSQQWVGDKGFQIIEALSQ
jgi:hypothetical protein